MSLTELMQHFFRLFGLRNAIFLEGLYDRLDLFSISVSDLQDAVRRARNPGAYALALSRCASRIFCIADHFRGSLPLVPAMVKKFPAAGCSYCHTKPCSCGVLRPEHTAFEHIPAQFEWSLREWQRHIRDVYGDRNLQRGIEVILNRLFREVEELRSVSRRVPRWTSSADEILHEHADELADALAWVISAANVLEVDLEKCVLGRYGGGCTSCLVTPCSCTHFSRIQIDWEPLLALGEIPIRLASEQIPR